MIKLLIYILIGTIWMAITMGTILLVAKVHNDSIKWDKFILLFLCKLFVWPLDIACSIYTFTRLMKGEVTDKETEAVWDDLCDE